MSGERKDYAVLISLSMREEAEVAAAALRADGIDAFVGNSNHATMEWGLVPALGGVQIMTPAARLAEAKQTLRARLAGVTVEDDAEPAVRRDRWKAWLAIALLFGPWLVYSAIGWGSDLGSWLYGISLGDV